MTKHTHVHWVSYRQGIFTDPLRLDLGLPLFGEEETEAGLASCLRDVGQDEAGPS